MILNMTRLVGFYWLKAFIIKLSLSSEAFEGNHEEVFFIYCIFFNFLNNLYRKLLWYNTIIKW